MQKPTSLKVGVVIVYVYAVLQVIAGIATFALVSDLGDPAVQASVDGSLAGAGVSVTASQLHGLAMGVAIMLIAVGVVMLLVAHKLGQGHAWARWVVSFVATLGFVGQFGSGFRDQWLQLVVDGVVLVAFLSLVWNRKAAAYIQAQSAQAQPAHV